MSCFDHVLQVFIFDPLAVVLGNYLDASRNFEIASPSKILSIAVGAGYISVAEIKVRTLHAHTQI